MLFAVQIMFMVSYLFLESKMKIVDIFLVTQPMFINHETKGPYCHIYCQKQNIFQHNHIIFQRKILSKFQHSQHPKKYVHMQKDQEKSLVLYFTNDPSNWLSLGFGIWFTAKCLGNTAKSIRSFNILIPPL